MATTLTISPGDNTTLTIDGTSTTYNVSGASTTLTMNTAVSGNTASNIVYSPTGRMSSTNLQTPFGNIPLQEKLIISSIFTTGFAEFDQNVVFITYHNANSLFEISAFFVKINLSNLKFSLNTSISTLYSLLVATFSALIK